MNQVEEVLLKHRAKLLAYLEKRVNDPFLAEDILQEGLLKAIQSAGDLRDEDRLLPWFYQILNRTMIDAFRSRNVEDRYLERYARDVETIEKDSGDWNDLCECFRELLPSLKPEYADLIERLELQGNSPEEVSEQLQISRSNLKVRHHRARQALRTRLEETCRTCAVHGCLDCTCQLDRKNDPNSQKV